MNKQYAIPNLKGVESPTSQLVDEPGTYSVEVAKVKTSTSARREPVHVYTLRVMDGVSAGKLIIATISLLENSKWRYKEFLEACNKNDVKTATELVGSQLRVRTKLDTFEGEERVKITRFLPIK